MHAAEERKCSLERDREKGRKGGIEREGGREGEREREGGREVGGEEGKTERGRSGEREGGREEGRKGMMIKSRRGRKKRTFKHKWKPSCSSPSLRSLALFLKCQHMYLLTQYPVPNVLPAQTYM